jgi:ubiquinone biosynthesis protein COQ9
MAANLINSFARNGLRNGIPRNWKLYSTARSASKYKDIDSDDDQHSSRSGKHTRSSPGPGLGPPEDSASSKKHSGLDTDDSGRFGDSENDDPSSKSEILEAALKYVNAKGWTMDAIRAGAEELYSSGEVSEIFNEYDLVKYFITYCNYDLETHLAKTPLNLQQALEYRLGKVVPYAPKFNEVLAHTTHPANVVQSVELLLKLSDAIAHYSLKDTSTDLSWYTKRLGIASIYATSELCLVQDKSPNFTNTFQFMKRRVYEFEQFNRGSGTFPLPDILSAGFTTLMNILGRNARR